jgi:NADH-quinone oxidoreductase subunit M
MVTMFVITTLAAVGLPMLNGFVGEFLILSGTMQSTITHHIGWTVVATTGVIFGAAYMLWMIQRVFYGAIGYRPNEVTGWDLTPREHLELWPFAALFLLLGVASPLFMRAIDTFGVTTSTLPSGLTYGSLDTPISDLLKKCPQPSPQSVISTGAQRSGETPVFRTTTTPAVKN